MFLYMESKDKFLRRFLLFIIGQLLLIIGSLSMGSQFKVVPQWLSLFAIFSFVGFILMFIAYLYLYKVNKNYLRSFIAFIIFVLLVILVDGFSHSKSDFYLVWSRGLEVSEQLMMCVVYTYFLLGTRDYLIDKGLKEHKGKTMVQIIVFISLFVIREIMEFISTLKVTKVHYVLYSICRYGSWGMQFVIDVFVFVVLLLFYINMRKAPKEEVIDEKE